MHLYIHLYIKLEILYIVDSLILNAKIVFKNLFFWLKLSILK